MAADASIYGMIRPVQPGNRLEQLAQAMQVKGLQDQSAFNSMKVDEYQRGLDRRSKLESLLSQSYDTPDARESALMSGGFIDEAGKLGKDRRENVKLDEATAGSRLDRQLKKVSYWRDNVFGVQSPEQAQQYVQAMFADPDLKGSPVTQVPMQNFLPQDGNIDAWRKQFALGAQKFIEKNGPTYQTRNTGGTTDTIALPGLGVGAPQVVSSVKNTMTPGDAARLAQAERHFQTTQSNAGNQYDSERGMIVNTITGQARPVMAGGGTLPPKDDAATKKELMSIRQQRAIVQGAIKDAQENPDAFSLTRGLATMAGPIAESVAGRFDTDQQTQARAYLFNNVSRIINERAGAAQSAQELARLRAFLPAETDRAEQIVSKMKAFDTYLNDLESGTRPPRPGNPAAPAAAPAAGPQVPRITGDAEYNALPSGATFIGPDGKTRRKP